MKFWLKRPGTSDFVGPLEIEEIRKQLAEGNLDWDFETMQATGQSLGALKRATGWRPLADTCKPPTIHQQPERAPTPAINVANLTVLKNVRRNTCYSALRNMIEVFASITVALVVVASGTYVFLGTLSGSPVLMIMGLVAGTLGILATWASKQASLLLVDIADVLVDLHRQHSAKQSVSVFESGVTKT